MRTWCVIAVVLAGPRAWAEEPDKTQDISPDDTTSAPTPPAPARPPTPAPAPPPAPKSHEEPVHTMDEVKVPASFLRFGINVFGDTSFFATTPDRPHSHFEIGTLGLRVLGQLSPSIDALGELAFETAEGEPKAEVEQLLIRWKSRFGALEVGRLHTDFGFWNRAYHHGRWLQTPIARPKAVRFEDDGGIIPVHWVGAHYTVQPTEEFAVTVGAGNGRGNIVDDVLVNSETNEAKAGLLKVRYKTTIGELGVGAIYDLIAPANAMIRPALPDQQLRELIGNAYVAVRGDGVIMIGEGYFVRHQAGSQSWMTYAAYGLLGYTFAERVTPYAAVDVISGGDDDPFFRPDPMLTPYIDVLDLIAGTRVDVSTWSALKLELRRLTRNDATRDGHYTVELNWSFGL